MDSKVYRNIHFLKEQIHLLDLDLSGLNVVTELASKAYMYTAVMAAMAGANVTAVGKTTHYGTFQELKNELETLLTQVACNPDISVFENDLPEEIWSGADIVTNSGMLRPITADVINLMKPTAVIPLMWESWEFRNEDLDIRACRKKGVAVAGTNENNRFFNLFKYNGILALKILFELKVDILSTPIAVIGNYKITKPMTELLGKINNNIIWCHDESGSDAIRSILDANDLGCLIIADMGKNNELIGKNGSISFSELSDRFPGLRIAHIAGYIDVKELEGSGLEYFPLTIAAPGYMSYSIAEVSDYPVFYLSLFGLKVGELIAKSRLSGKSIEESIQYAVDFGIGMDFKECH